MRAKMVRYIDGVRYWATKARHPMNGRPCLFFWSSHDWPFFHGHYQPDWMKAGRPPTSADRKDAWRHFLNWIPA